MATSTIERAILEPVGAEVVALQAKSEDGPRRAGADCDAIMNQYARVGAPTIARMQRCQVIARYGVGVDIVDVEAATAQGHPGHQCPRLLHRRGRRPCHRAVADARAQAHRVRPRHPSGRLALADRASPIHRLRGRTHGHRVLRQDRPGHRRRARKAFGVDAPGLRPLSSPTRPIARRRRRARWARTSCSRGPT